VSFLDESCRSSVTRRCRDGGRTTCDGETAVRRQPAVLSGRLRERYGPWAVITGASSGIGREFAVQVSAAGLDVVLVARRQDLLEQLAGELHARHGIECRVVAADLAHPVGVDQVTAATHDLDVGLLVAAAGFGASGPFLAADLPTELAMLQVNCAAVLAMTRHYSDNFTRRGRGGLILLGSLVGYQGVARAATYAATKAWVQTLAEGLHLELRPLGIDVLSVAPGPVHSGFADNAGMTMSRAQRPADIAAPALAAPWPPDHHRPRSTVQAAHLVADTPTPQGPHPHHEPGHGRDDTDYAVAFPRPSHCRLTPVRDNPRCRIRCMSVLDIRFQHSRFCLWCLDVEHDWPP